MHPLPLVSPLPIAMSCRFFVVVTAVMAVRRGALTGLVLFPPSSGSFLSFFSRNIPGEMWSTNPQVIGRLSQVMAKEKNAIQTGGGKTIYETLSHSQEEWATPAAQQQKIQPIRSTHERVPARSPVPASAGNPKSQASIFLLWTFRRDGFTVFHHSHHQASFLTEL